MGGETSKVKCSRLNGNIERLPAIRLPQQSHSYYGGMCKKPSEPDISRNRTGSASSRSPRHPLPLKMRRLIQSCFCNPHELIGRRIMKRACDLRHDFGVFYCALTSDIREDLEESIKLLLKKVVTNIDFLDEIQRLSEEFGTRFCELRPLGFKTDFFAVLADATIKECTHLDSAVHKAHTTTQAFSQFGAIIYSAVRDGFYVEVRRLRKNSNSFSTGSNGSQQRQKRSVDSDISRGNSPRASFSVSRCGSPRSLSPELSDDCFQNAQENPSDGYLKIPRMSVAQQTRTA